MNAGRPRIIVVERAALAESAARWLAERIADVTAAKGGCRLALAGGSTPAPAYRALAARELAWRSVEIFFGDERAVPPGDPDSNYRMARESLLDHAPLDPHHIHRMAADRPDLEAAAAEYGRLVEEPLDILVLGVGADGHTASLFPGSPALEESARRVVAVTGPNPPTRRLTITPPVVAAACDIVVLAAGADKAAPLARAVSTPSDPRALPIQLALRGTWIVDRDAAAQLPGAGA